MEEEPLDQKRTQCVYVSRRHGVQKLQCFGTEIRKRKRVLSKWNDSVCGETRNVTTKHFTSGTTGVSVQ